MPAIAHEGCTDTERKSALKVVSARKIPCRTGKSNVRQPRAGPTLYQPSYIPVQADIFRHESTCASTYFEGFLRNQPVFCSVVLL